MGIFDFLGDLSSKRSKDLGLGGLQSLLGTRRAAEAGARGDEMMKITGNDSLPGYFNEQTREYVPWYVDLFDGGGLNSAGGEAGQMPAASTGLLGGGPSPRRTGVQAQAAPALGSQLSDMERLNRMPGVDPRNLGGAEGYGQTGVAPGGTIVPLDEILTPEEIARRDANARLDQIQNGNSTFADFVRMDNSGGPAGFQPSPEPSSMQSLDQPFGSRIVPASTAGPSLQPFDRDIQRNMPSYPAQAFGVVGTDTMMGRQVNPNAPVDAAEFQRFRSQFEDILKSNGQWGFPDREAAAFQSLKASGQNY
tara:strand:- start:189 stop:1109 length:921 start_codon:yes stop_codon:yes gene_type:complete